jgi:hypothetical protein
MSLLDGFLSLANPTNKLDKQGGELRKEGASGDREEFVSHLSPDEDLLEQSLNWKKRWEEEEGKLNKKREESEKYWLGRHWTPETSFDTDRPLTDNVMFEAIETFLPVATKRSPEPVVIGDGTPMGDELAGDVRRMLLAISDEEKLRVKMKLTVRWWALHYLGVMKIAYEGERIRLLPVRADKFILDPTATINVSEYEGRYLGERREKSASELIEQFPDSAKEIMDAVGLKVGTKVKYVEWWTRDSVFWTMEKKLLGKMANPHWNEDSQNETVDEFGNPITVPVPALNHFREKRMPYVFLSIFNLGKKPYDETSLVEQNLANQDKVNKRQRQIDKNLDGRNGAMVFDGDHFTQQEAGQAMSAIRKGDGVIVPHGPIGDSMKLQFGMEFPPEVFSDLNDARNELRNIFGTSGLTASSAQRESTVRGKIIIGDRDQSRVGGLIAEYIEQFVDDVFNWMVQMMYVYYDEPHYAAYLSDGAASKMVEIQRSRFAAVKRLQISVKEGSTIPQDPMTRRNEAVDLCTAGLLDPLTMFERLDYPNPAEAVARLIAWKTNPAALGGFAQPEMGGIVPPAEQGVPAVPGQPPTEPPKNNAESIMSKVPLSQIPM